MFSPLLLLHYPNVRFTIIALMKKVNKAASLMGRKSAATRIKKLLFEPMKNVSKAASVMGRKSAAARIQKWGKKEFVHRMQEWGKLGGRPKGTGKKKRGAK